MFRKKHSCSNSKNDQYGNSKFIVVLIVLAFIVGCSVTAIIAGVIIGNSSNAPKQAVQSGNGGGNGGDSVFPRRLRQKRCAFDFATVRFAGAKALAGRVGIAPVVRRLCRMVRLCAD